VYVVGINDMQDSTAVLKHHVNLTSNI